MKNNAIMRCMSVRMVASEAEAVALALRGIFTVEQLLKYGEMSRRLAEALRKNKSASRKTSPSD